MDIMHPDSFQNCLKPVTFHFQGVLYPIHHISEQPWQFGLWVIFTQAFITSILDADEIKREINISIRINININLCGKKCQARREAEDKEEE